MVEITAFRRSDLSAFDLRAHPAAAMLGVEEWRRMAGQAATAGPAWTGRHAGRVIGCAGVALIWPGRAAAWCLLAADIPTLAWIGIHRAVARRLAHLPALGVRRVEADVLDEFAPGHRWARMLGFSYEGRMRAYGPTGLDYHRYARTWPDGV